MVFLEELPPQCPPPQAKDAAIEGAYRVVSCAQPTMEDFQSHAELGYKIRPGTDPCRWRSCSLFLSKDKARDIAGLLPKTRMKNPHLARVVISQGDGQSLVINGHVDFWISTKFKLATAIKELEKV
jgi:hypothetical protein